MKTFAWFMVVFAVVFAVLTWVGIAGHSATGQGFGFLVQGILWAVIATHDSRLANK